MTDLMLVIICLAAVGLFVWAQIQNMLIRQRQRAVYEFIMLVRNIIPTTTVVNSESVQTDKSEWPNIILLSIALLFLFWMLSLIR